MYEMNEESWKWISVRYKIDNVWFDSTDMLNNVRYIVEVF